MGENMFVDDSSIFSRDSTGSREYSMDTNNLEDASLSLQEFAKALDIHRAGNESSVDLIRRYGELSSDLAKNSFISNDPEYAKDRVLETKLWSLVFNLYSYRLSTIEPMSDIPSYASNILFIEKYLLDHPEIKENWILLDWLQSNFNMPQPPKNLQGKWLHTRHLIQQKNLPHMQASKTSNILGGIRLDENLQNVVSELDADAPNRQSKSLSKEDVNFDREVNRHVFELLRANQITKALEFCAETGNWSLRLAISGTYEYLDATIDGLELNLEDDGNGGKGSENKALWRRACGAAAERANDPYEKAVYGVLSGDLDSVLNLSDTWETQFYAYMSHIVACEEEKILTDAGRIDLKKISLLNAGRSNSKTFSVQEVLDLLSQSSNPVVRKQSAERHRILMGAAIVRSVSHVIANMAEIYENAANGEDFDADIIEDFDLLRVLIHFALFLKTTGEDIGNEDNLSVLVRSYVTYLALEKLDHLAPLYICYLPYDSALDIYSSLLADISDASQRKEHLQLGKKYQLDMNNAVRRAVAKIFKETESEYLLGNRELEFMNVLDGNDERRINGIQWFIDAGLWADAVHSSVYAYRDFLSCSKYVAARALGSKVNVTSMISTYRKKKEAFVSDSDSPEVPNEEIYELGEYEKLVDYFQHLETWESHFASMPTESINSFRQLPQDWLSLALQLVNRLGETVYNLTDTWMSNVEYPVGSAEWKLLDQLRTLYVPFIIMSYLVVLTNARPVHSKFLKEAADLATLVADENSKRYVLFIRSGCLQEFLRKVSLAVTDGMESNAIYDTSK